MREGDSKHRYEYMKQPDMLRKPWLEFECT